MKHFKIFPIFPFYKILPFHLINEILPPCILIFAILSILVLCQQVSRNSELFFLIAINFEVFFKILLSLLPPIFTFTLPISIAIGEIITLSRLASDHQWTALEAGGLNRFARFSPFLFVGVLGFALIIAINWNLAPQAMTALKEMRKSLLMIDVTSLIRPQTFISEFPGLLLKVGAIDQQTGKWDNVLLLRKADDSAKLQLLAAKSGRLIPVDRGFGSFEIKLLNGVFIDNLFSEKDHITSVFRENTIKIIPKKVSEQDYPAETSILVQLETMSDLLVLSRLKHNQAGHKLPSNDALAEILKRFGNAFACIFASMCALVLATKLHDRTAKRSILLLLTFLLLVIYYISLAFGQNLVLNGTGSWQQVIVLEYVVPFFILVITYLSVSKDFFISLSNYKSHFFAKIILKKYLGAPTSALQINEPKTLPKINYGHYIILSEFAKLLILSLIILITTILLFTLLDIAPSIARNNIRFEFALGYLLRLSPQILYYVVPFGVLLAVVATGATLARSGQLSMLLYYSINPMKIALPIITGTIIIYLGILLLSETILPYSNREQDNRYRKIKGRAIEETTISLDHQWIVNENPDIVYGFHAIEEAGVKRLTSLIIKLTNPNYYLNEIVYMNITEKYKDGVQLGFRYKIGESGLAEFISLKKEDLPTEAKNQEMITATAYREASKMSIKQLQAYISQLERTGLPTTSLRMEKMQKIAFPFTCITLLFLAFPICLLQLKRQYQSRFSIIAISIGLALLFWGILSIFEVAGKRGTLPIIIAAWSPHALFLALTSSIQLKLFHW